MGFTLKIDKIIDLVLAANTSYIYCKNRQIIDPILVTNACVCVCVCSRARAYFSLFSGKKYLTKQANKQQYYKTKDSYIAFVVLRLHRQLKVVPEGSLLILSKSRTPETVRLRGGSEGLRTREVRFARALHVRSQLRTAIALEPASAGQRHHCPALERTLAVARPCTRVSSHPHCHAPVHPHWPYTHPRAPPRVLPGPRPDLQR